MTTISPDPWVTELVNTGLSGNVQVSQGFSSGQSTAGDALNFFFDTQALYLSSSYDSLDVIASNLNPLLPGTTHMGAGDYYDGHVYSVIEHWHGCGASSDPIFIAVFNAQTLTAEQSIEISAYIPEASGIAIDYDTGLAIVSSFCDAHNLYVFRMSDWRFFGTIPLAIPVSRNQGLAYRNGFLYCAGTGGDLYGLRLSDRTMKHLMHVPLPGEYEGIDFHSPHLRWLVNRSRQSHILYSYLPVYSP